MQIADIRVIIEDLSHGVDDTDAGTLGQCHAWLKEHATQPRPDGAEGVIVDRNVQCAAEAFSALIEAYEKQDWSTVKRRARVIQQALG